MNAQYADAPDTKGIRVLVDFQLPEGTQLYTTYNRPGHGTTLKPTRKSQRVQTGYIIETHRGDGHYHYVAFLNPIHCSEWYEAIAWIYQEPTQ